MLRMLRSNFTRGYVATLLLLCVTAFSAEAHPNESSAYSMRSLVRLSETGLHAMVMLEVPISVAMEEFRERYIKTDQVDPDNIEQKHIDEFNRLQWSRLASGLNIKINEVTPEGSWVPVETPINGKANAGFFVYMLGYKLDEPDVDLGARVSVQIDNQAFPDVKVFLSGFADSRDPWQVKKNSAETLLGKAALVREANLDPKAWTLDSAMRQLLVVYTRTE
jgi:hypothetical protein